MSNDAIDTAASLPSIAPSIAVVIPAYKAERHIRSVIARIPDFVEHIVVVDDGSPDGTAAIVKEMVDRRVILVSHPDNRGVGAAVLSGYCAAVAVGSTIVVKIDADDQMDPAYLRSLITPICLHRADYAKGNRFFHARALEAMPASRRFGNACLSLLTKIASGYWNIFDPTNGYTAIHASLIGLLDRSRIDQRYFFESSMLVELSLLRAVACDVYIPARYGDERSGLSEWEALAHFPGRLLKGLGRRLWIQYFVRDFTLFTVYLVFGLLLTGFGVIWGLVHWMRNAPAGIETPAGTVMIAVLPIIVGIQLLIQAVALDVQGIPVVPRHLDLKSPLAVGRSRGPGNERHEEWE